MNFSIYIDDATADTLRQLANQTGKSRNALINEALRAFFAHQRKAAWPRKVIALAGAAPDMPSFESHRAELAASVDDPLA